LHKIYARERPSKNKKVWEKFPPRTGISSTISGFIFRREWKMSRYGTEPLTGNGLESQLALKLSRW